MVLMNSDVSIGVWFLLSSDVLVDDSDNKDNVDDEGDNHRYSQSINLYLRHMAHKK